MKTSERREGADSPDGVDMYAFGGLHDRRSNRFDGIQRSPGALTTEQTHRLVQGSPDFYMVGLYRWVEWPAAELLGRHALKLGEVLRQNKLILPARGCEAAYWDDATSLIRRSLSLDSAPIRDTRVYFLICGVHPQLLRPGGPPFLLLDVTHLSPHYS